MMLGPGWQKASLVGGLIGFSLQILALAISAARGSQTDIAVLKATAVTGIVLWTAWVTITLISLTRNSNSSAMIQAVVQPPPGYTVKNVYFDGVGRDILGEIEAGAGGDATEKGVAGNQLAKLSGEGFKLKVKRLDARYRWIMSVIKYQNTASARTDRFIPGDDDRNAPGERARFVYVQFKAYVERDAQVIDVRLRGQGGTWLKTSTSGGADAVRTVRISGTDWAPIDALLGPIRTDQACYVTFDVTPGGPTGENQALWLRDLRVLELRPANRTAR